MIYCELFPRVGGFKDKDKRKDKEMSTSNFKSMDNFPLIVAEDSMIKYCPDCGISNAEDADKCEDCGCDLADVSPVYDDCEMDYICEEMKKVAEEINSCTRFHNVTLMSGYYSGIQFYVSEEYCDIESMTNEETNEEFGLCRSVTLRKYKSEVNFICRELRKARENLGLMELGVVARFSNGETMYTEIKPTMTNRERLKVAVNAA